jgi:cytoskeletal protein CcmA (bactofilin family)
MPSLRGPNMRAQRAIAAELEPIKAEREACRLVPSDEAAIEPSEDAIRLRSQQIWESEGRPEGYAQDHWERARAELAEQMAKMANRPQVETAIPEPTAPVEPQADIGALRQTIADDVREASPTAWLLPPAKQSIVPSIICSGLVFHGLLESPGELNFDGGLEGEIRAAELHVGAQAVIQGEIMAGTVTVHGSIRGRIRAGKVVLCAGSRVEGEIEYETLTVQNGARAEARFRQASPETKDASR